MIELVIFIIIAAAGIGLVAILASDPVVVRMVPNTDNGPPPFNVPCTHPEPGLFLCGSPSSLHASDRDGA